MTVIEGKRDGSRLRFAVVVSRFNPEITERLEAGALEALKQAGVNPEAITVIRVPGAFEIPLAAQRAARSGRYDGIVAVGCVIRGETPHFDYISQVMSRGIGRVSLECDVPVAFGVLTADTDEQAVARSEPGPTNKGFEAAMAAVEMANILKQI